MPVSLRPGVERTLSPQSLEKLLALLDPDRRRAAEKYELLRAKLMRFFEWRNCNPADEATDETIDRVGRRLAEGETIDNPAGYFYGVAHRVALELGRKAASERLAVDGVRLLAPDTDSDDWQARMRCLEQCLGELRPAQRALLIDYYQGDKAARIAARRTLAQQLGTTVDALRIRAHRARADLERCVRECTKKLGLD